MLLSKHSNSELRRLFEEAAKTQSGEYIEKHFGKPPYPFFGNRSGPAPRYSDFVPQYEDKNGIQYQFIENGALLAVRIPIAVRKANPTIDWPWPGSVVELKPLQEQQLSFDVPPNLSPPITQVNTCEQNATEAPNSQHRGSLSFRSKMERNLRLLQQRKKPVLQPRKVQRMIKAYVREEKSRPDVRCTKATIEAFSGWLESEMEQRPLVAQAIARVEGKRTLLLKHVQLAEKFNPKGNIRLSEKDLKDIHHM